MAARVAAPPSTEASGGMTCARWIDIERGDGEPATEAERAGIEEFESRPAIRALFLKLREAAPTIRAAKHIYENAEPHEQRRLENMTHSEVVAWHRATKQARPVSGVVVHERASAAARPRERRARRSQRSSARGDPDPEPEPEIAGLLAVVSARMLAHIRRREARWRLA
jgi:hypothetical protein